MQISTLHGLPEAARREWRALEAETDPQLFLESSLNFAQRLEAAGRVEAAAELYAEVVGANLGPHSLREDEASGGVAPGQGGGGRTPTSLGPVAFGGAPGSPLQRRAQAGLDAILGRGAAGPRAEFLLRNLAQQASDPTMLFAMGTAGAVFRMTRLATLSRLAAAPNPGMMTQLLGGGRLASLTGFALEAPAFTLAARLGNEALGRPQDWSGGALGRDFASSYLVLGGLKLAGWASGAAYRRLANPVGAVRACPPLRRERPLQTLFQQGGMLTGILLGHSLEEHLGLRPRHDGATTLTDSLALLLQFHVAGRLTRQAFGPRFAAWERGLDLQSEALARAARGPLSGSSGVVTGRAWTPALAAGPSLEPGEYLRPPIHMMIQGNGNGGNGDGNGGKPPGRTPTILGVGRSSPPPAPPRTGEPRRSETPPRPGSPSRSETPPKLEAPRYSEGTAPPIPGLSPQARALSLDGLKIETLDPGARLAEGLDQYFRHYRDPVVVTLGSNTLFELRAQGLFKVELHRLYREHAVPDEVAVTLLLPSENLALHFRRQGLGFGMERVDLRPPAGRASPRPASAPAMARPPLPRSERVSSPDFAPRVDGAEAERFEGVKAEFRKALRTIETSATLAPAIRLNVGRVDERGLQHLADILGEHPLPEGRKITVFWMERGGGNLSLQRQGELIRAEWKGFQVPRQVFWLAPTESRLGHFQVYRAEALPAYAYESPRSYETLAEQGLRRLHVRLGYPGRFEDLDARSDGSARRGEILAKLSLHWLRENASSHRTLTPNAQADFIEIHRILERAHALLDLGMPKRFSEHLGPAKLRGYRDVLEGINRARVAAGESLLLPLEEFAADLPGDYVLPVPDVLRWAFADQLFKDRGGSRIPLENNALRRDPQRLGHIFRETLRSRALPLLAAIKMVERAGAGETLRTLMVPGRRDLNPYHDKLRRDVAFFLQEWSEVGRVFHGGHGAFHRRFLSEIFTGPRGIRGLYGQVLDALKELPPELLRRERLEDLPSVTDLDAAMRGSRP